MLLIVSALKTSEEYIEFIMDKFSGLETVSCKKMFGGYVLHFAGRVMGFVFGEEFLFEPGPNVDRLLPDARRMELFPGSKLFAVIDESMSPRRLCELAIACYEDMPVPKPRKRKIEKGKASQSEEMERRKEIDERFPFARRFR